MSANIKIVEVSWSKAHKAISEVRRTVFIEEQKVPKELEWDGIDKDCRHILAREFSLEHPHGIPVGTGRLVSDGQIGRMAILKDYRRLGIGRRILQELIRLAISDGHRQVFLHAQLSAVEFYQRAGFESTGDTFMDAGIPHIKMKLNLQ